MSTQMMSAEITSIHMMSAEITSIHMVFAEITSIHKMSAEITSIHMVSAERCTNRRDWKLFQAYSQTNCAFRDEQIQ